VTKRNLQTACWQRFEGGKGTLLNISADWAIWRTFGLMQVVSQPPYSSSVYRNSPLFSPRLLAVLAIVGSFLKGTNMLGHLLYDE
jgi:hypothetical protein